MHPVSIKFMEIMTLLRTDFSNYLGTLSHSGYLGVSPNGKKKMSQELRVEDQVKWPHDTRE